MNLDCNCPASRRNDPSNEYVEGVVCTDSDITENELKEFPLDKGKILLVKQKGQIHAIATTCTHYSAPLVNGALGDGRVRCPWHGACFNVTNGDIEEFPGLDSLPCFQVTVNNNNVTVRAKKSDLGLSKRVKPMIKRNLNDLTHFVVIGGGTASAECVEALRQEGFEGEITMVCKENYLPYDRVKASKAMDFGIDQAQFRTDAFYSEYGINVLKGVEATGINAGNKTISLSNGNSLKYDKLFMATGAKPRRLTICRENLGNIVVLNNYEDAHYTNSKLGKDKEIVVLGSSFIGLESASYCVDKVKKLTVVTNDDVPFQILFGPRVGAAVMNFFKENGVYFELQTEIVKINGDNEENVCSVELDNGKTLKSDVLILGIGSVCNTDWIKNSGVQVRPDGTIETDEYLQTNQPDVFAGGEMAYAPVWSNKNRKDAIGHFGLALYHGKIAALNMLGRNKMLQTVPFFWTKLFGKSIRYVGHGSYDEIIHTGNVEELKFVAFYLKDDEVVALSSCGMDPVAAQFAEYLSQGKTLLKQYLQEDPLSWTQS